MSDAAPIAQRLTKRTVDAAAPASTARILWCADLAGFGLKIQPSGLKTYIAQYRTAGGRRGQTRRVTLGRHGVLTADQARAAAEKVLASAKLGDDEALARATRRKAITMAELAARYIELHAKPNKKASSLREDEANLRNHILPVFGAMAAIDLKTIHIEKFMAARAKTPANANLCLALMRHLLNKAEDWGDRPRGSNPCVGVKCFVVKARERFLSEEEIGRLGMALDAAAKDGENPKGLAIIRLCLMTGARKSELMALKWDEVDEARVMLRLADSKTGRKTTPIGQSALDLILAQPREASSPYVFPGARPRRAGNERGHYQGLNKVWFAVRARAGLGDVRLHDLRHTAASIAAGAGASLPVIARILGHADVKTTQRYAHLTDAPVRRVAEQVADVATNALAKISGDLS
jgi:integrase